MHSIWVALAGAAVYLDATAVGQLMIGQPLIACPLWGLIVGRPEIGLFFGVVFQFLWSGSLAIGAGKFPEGGVGALVATALAARVPPLESGEPAWVVLAVAALIGIAAAQLGGEVTPVVRKVMSRYAPRVVDAAAGGHNGRFRILFGGAILIHAITGFTFTLLMFLGGTWLFSLYTGTFSAGGISSAVAGSTDSLLSGIWPALLGAGVAVIVRQFVSRRHLVWFVVPALLFFAVGLLWQS